MNNPPSEGFGTVPNTSESFGTLPHASEPFRTVRNDSERTEHHTLTVREVARLFEQAAVPRTERSITNWCQINRQGVARLNAFFDVNEGRYYITPESVTRAIEEERAKQPAVSASESEPTFPKPFEKSSPRPAGDDDQVKELERRNRDLEIATRGKDYYIERLEKERSEFVEKMVGMGRYVGELETQVFHLGGSPAGDRSLPNASETFGRKSNDDRSNAEPVDYH